MKRTDAMVLASVGLVALVAAFWFGVLAPKRKDASDLKTQVGQLQAQLSQQQQTIATAQQARSSFVSDYHKLVVLGKAVPADSEQASLLIELNTLADRAGVSFRSLTLNQGAAGAPPAPVAPVASTTSTTSSTTSSTTTSTSTTPTDTTATTATDATAAPAGVDAAAAPATEASAATLPLGAAIGPAGLPVMPYELKFTGGYFEISKFLHSVDALVHTPQGGVTVSGRLVTVNGFDLSPPQAVGPTTGAPSAKAGTLEASLSVTTYVAPADQGLAGGATPTAPAPVTPATSVPTAAPAAATP